MRERVVYVAYVSCFSLDPNIPKATADMICPITFNSISDAEYFMCCGGSCRQLFHAAALQEWLRTHSTCPCCRAPWTCYSIYKT